MSDYVGDTMVVRPYATMPFHTSPRQKCANFHGLCMPLTHASFSLDLAKRQTIKRARNVRLIARRREGRFHTRLVFGKQKSSRPKETYPHDLSAKKTVAHPASAHTLRRTYDDPATPAHLDRHECTSSIRCFTKKWQGRAGEAPARVNPTLKKSPIWGIKVTTCLAYVAPPVPARSA